MDLTPWLEYFADGLATQLQEVQSLGEQVIRRDAPALQHHLNDRQRLALGYALEHGAITVQEFEGLAAGVNRRTLQRDLTGLVEKGLLRAEGATNRLRYALATK